MPQNSTAPTLAFPLTEPPPPGGLVEIAPGVQWFRLPLPYRLDHVNVYLIKDEGGWTVLDTGLGTDVCRAAWEAILNGPLAGQRLISMIVTHFHPDHVGLAGWLADRFGLPLSMPRPEYLYSLALQYAPGDLGADMHRPFFRRHGLSHEVTEAVLGRGHEYLRQTTGVPTTYHRIQHGDTLRIGVRAFRVITGGGHALEQAMLYRPEERLFFAADQVIARISPNVSVHAMEPDLDALGIYLRSLSALRDAVAPDVLVGRGEFGTHLGPVAVQLFGHQLSQRGIGTLSHFRARDADDDAVIRVNHDPGIDLGRDGRLCLRTAKRKPEFQREPSAQRGGYL